MTATRRLPTPIGVVSIPSLNMPSKRGCRLYSVFSLREEDWRTEVLVEGPLGLAWLQVSRDQVRIASFAHRRNAVFSSEGPDGLAVVFPSERALAGFDLYHSGQGRTESTYHKDLSDAVRAAESLAGAPAARVA